MTLAANLDAKLFQSTLPCGSDHLRCYLLRLLIHFNPRSLAGATKDQQNVYEALEFQSTLPCGSDFFAVAAFKSTSISIHAPLRERLGKGKSSQVNTNISIHAPLRERRIKSLLSLMFHVFQSTLPCGSDSIKRKYFSFHLNQAFIAN